MHPIKSIQARTQSFFSKHFEWTRHGRKLAKLKNTNINNRCFVIGNGPSLRPEDLTTLFNNNIPCFASNNIFKIFDKTVWRPTYYVCEDILVLEDLHKKISQTNFDFKFIPINYKWYNDIKISNAHYFLQSFEKNIELSDNIPHSIVCKSTVTTTAIQLAAYMGYTEIYLLGVDHSYRTTRDNAGNIIVDPTATDYFDNNYAETMKKKDIPNTEATTQSYIDAKNQLDKRGVTVYNATRGGKLEVFPRIDFDTLF